ncbi:hypothetical protein YB2330_005251 [Saitoella coloradoensis]
MPADTVKLQTPSKLKTFPWNGRYERLLLDTVLDRFCSQGHANRRGYLKREELHRAYKEALERAWDFGHIPKGPLAGVDNGIPTKEAITIRLWKLIHNYLDTQVPDHAEYRYSDLARPKERDEDVKEVLMKVARWLYLKRDDDDDWSNAQNIFFINCVCEAAAKAEGPEVLNVERTVDNEAADAAWHVITKQVNVGGGENGRTLYPSTTVDKLQAKLRRLLRYIPSEARVDHFEIVFQEQSTRDLWKGLFEMRKLISGYGLSRTGSTLRDSPSLSRPSSPAPQGSTRTGHRSRPPSQSSPLAAPPPMFPPTSSVRGHPASVRLAETIPLTGQDVPTGDAATTTVPVPETAGDHAAAHAPVLGSVDAVAGATAPGTGTLPAQGASRGASPHAPAAKSGGNARASGGQTAVPGTHQNPPNTKL